MQIVIDIPENFENHFNSDKFEDSLQRVRFDIHKAFAENKDVLSGNYEIETLDMLTEAFLNGTPLPKGHGRLIDINEITAFRELECNGHDVESLDKFTVIIEADKEGKGENI